MNIISDRNREYKNDPQFPNAPANWDPTDAMKRSRHEGIELTDDHWDTLKALQEYFARHGEGDINIRGLHDALDEKFHLKGGMKYLYKLFPGGPVAQGGHIGGLDVPAGTKDNSFGSVQ